MKLGYAITKFELIMALYGIVFWVVVILLMAQAATQCESEKKNQNKHTPPYRLEAYGR